MYGTLGRGGFMQMGDFAQRMSNQPLSPLPTGSPVVPPKPPIENISGNSPASAMDSMAKLLMDRDSQTKGQFGDMPSSGGSSDFIASEPGAMSVLGLSTGTAFDRQGQGYDTTNLDIGALAGGLLGGVAGPIGGLAGGLAGRQADLNAVLGAERNPGLFTAGQRTGMQLSRGEQRAQREARDWWNQQNPAATAFQAAQPAAPRGSPQLERLLTQAKAERGTPSAQAPSNATKGQSYGSNSSKRGK
jgi:hypothetical protein